MNNSDFKILIVDDIPKNIQVLGNVLTGYEYNEENGGGQRKTGEELGLLIPGGLPWTPVAHPSPSDIHSGCCFIDQLTWQGAAECN